RASHAPHSTRGLPARSSQNRRSDAVFPTPASPPTKTSCPRPVWLTAANASASIARATDRSRSSPARSGLVVVGAGMRLKLRSLAVASSVHPCRRSAQLTDVAHGCERKLSGFLSDTSHPQDLPAAGCRELTPRLTIVDKHSRPFLFRVEDFRHDGRANTRRLVLPRRVLAHP